MVTVLILGIHPDISHCLHITGFDKAWHYLVPVGCKFLHTLQDPHHALLVFVFEHGDRKVDFDTVNVNMVDNGISHFSPLSLLPLSELDKARVRVRVNVIMLVVVRVSIKVRFRGGGGPHPANANHPTCSFSVQFAGTKMGTMCSVHCALWYGLIAALAWNPF